jgi:hypothetical protein
LIYINDGWGNRLRPLGVQSAGLTRPLPLYPDQLVLGDLRLGIFLIFGLSGHTIAPRF